METGPEKGTAADKAVLDAGRVLYLTPSAGRLPALGLNFA